MVVFWDWGENNWEFWDGKGVMIWGVRIFKINEVWRSKFYILFYFFFWVFGIDVDVLGWKDKELCKKFYLSKVFGSFMFLEIKIFDFRVF